MPYSVKRFTLEHLDSFEARDDVAFDLKEFKKCLDMQDIWLKKIKSFTLMFNDTPIMVFGFLNGGYGTYYPMVLTSKGIDKHRFAVVRCMYKYTEQCIGSDVRRFEANVSVQDKTAARFVEYFGFEPVGIRRNAAPDGSDQIIYERLWG